MTVGGRYIPLEFDGRKFFLNVHAPSEQDMSTMDIVELTYPFPFTPETSISSRRDRKRKYKDYTGGITMETWRKRLTLSPEDVVRKIFDTTTQLCTTVEAENRAVGRRHIKSRFTILEEKSVKIINDN